MRRHSLTGPLILILIGLVFLLWNIHPEWVSFELIARYWPYLLIAWGLIRLVEIFFWQFTSKPMPSRGLSGGEWILIVLICLIGSGMFFVHERRVWIPRAFIGDRGVELFGEPYDYPVPEQRQAVKVARVVIDNQRGNTRIAGADADEIKVGGRKTVRAYQPAQADDANKRTPVEIITQGDQVTIRTSQERVSGNLRVSTDLEITVPRGASIQASGRTGDFDILNVGGGVEIKSGSAGVRLQDIGGNARVDLSKGSLVRAVNVKGTVEILGRGDDVELENIGGAVTINGYYSGDIQCRNLAKPILFQSGTTELHIARLPGLLNMNLGDLTLTNAEGPIRVTARSKDLHLDDLQGDLEVSLDRGDVTLLPRRSPAGKIDVTTRGGDLELTVPADAKFELDGVTHRGGIENEFGPPLQVSSDGPRISVKGSTGKGAQITLRTDRGQIKIRKQ